MYPNKRILFLLILSIILLILGRSNFGSSYKNKLHEITYYPIQLVISKIKIGLENIVSSIDEIYRLREENKNLKIKLRKLLKEQLQWQEAINENEQLKGLLNCKEIIAYNTICGQVVDFEPTNWFSTIIINKGGMNGVRKGSVVATYQDNYLGLVLVGRVINVFPRYSTVMLIFDQNSMVGSRILRNGVAGVVEGRNKQTCVLKFLPYDVDIKLGDVVVCSPESKIFPEGLLIGYINSAPSKKYSLLQEVGVQPLMNISKLKNVLIIQKEE